MNRLLWKESLTEHHSPRWPCPGCQRGILRLIPKSLDRRETMRSKRLHTSEEWDPQDVDYVFTAWVKCATCGQEVAVSGVGGVEPGYEMEGMTWVEYFAPRLLAPMPDIFTIPKKCPTEVAQKLRASFAVFWIDQGAATTRVRVALEKLLDHVGIKKRRRDTSKKLHDLTLHLRIEEFTKRDPEIGAQLMALKWLGNTGSHEGKVSRDDLLDAFQIMEHALAEVIEHRSAKVSELAKQLAKKHRPKRRR